MLLDDVPIVAQRARDLHGQQTARHRRALQQEGVLEEVGAIADDRAQPGQLQLLILEPVMILYQPPGCGPDFSSVGNVTAHNLCSYGT